MGSTATSSDLSTDSSISVDANNHPTYTTVGSIYNPKSTTPLAPPTRRPRTRRYPQALRSPSSGAFITFPDALLSTLPLEDHPPRSPPTTASILRQYSPLQQNYDRAVTPVGEREHTAFVKSNMAGPSIRSGNLPSSTGFESNDSVSAEDALTSRITVKGLTNLASYPNPMQKAAQNTLARARAANLGFSRPGTPSSLRPMTPDLSGDRSLNSYATKPTTTGPPQPLKAGPPGQRAFKPTTLDAASRTIRAEDQPSQTLYQSKSPIGYEYNLDTNLLTALDEDDGIKSTGRSVRLPFDEKMPALIPRNHSDFVDLGRLCTASPFDTASGVVEGERRKVHDTLPPERIKHYFPSGFPPNYDGRHKPIADDWHTKYPASENRFAQETFSTRITKINRNFYAGTEGLVRNMEQIVRDHNYRCLENKVGVIGEERERLRGSHIERLGADGKVQPPALNLNELNQMGQAEVARPLVNMAFATLLSYKEKSESGLSGQNSWPTGFIKADDAWVDATQEGNTSFFSKPGDDVREKTSKEARRGY
ncbi:hypothetical protein P885DRAFT_67899 [Corynascus similis CBS 632.67]